MNVIINSLVVGKESRTSNKGTPYTVVAFMDGVNKINALVDTACDVSNIPVGSFVDLDLEVNLGKYSNVKLKAWNNK